MILCLPQNFFVSLHGQSQLRFPLDRHTDHFDFGLAVIAFHDDGIASLYGLVFADIIIGSAAGPEADADEAVFQTMGFFNGIAIEAVLVGL